MSGSTTTTNFDLSPLLNSTAGAKQFGTDTIDKFEIPGIGIPNPGYPYIAGPDVYAANTRWDIESGPPWTEGGTDTLTYTLTATDNAYQVITFKVTNGQKATVATVYGQLIAFTPDCLFMQGYLSFDPTTGALSNPLSSQGGLTDYFIYTSDGASRSGVEQNSEVDNDVSDPTGLYAPFGLTVLTGSCFAAGTLLSTGTGPIAVEDIAIGHAVATGNDLAGVVDWVGHYHVRCDQHRQPASVRPVIIQAGAFGDNLPVHDLALSPDHAIYHDSVLIPAGLLVNGASIRQVAAGAITYYHIALARHGVLLAEGLPVESYLDTGAMPRQRPATARPAVA